MFAIIARRGSRALAGSSNVPGTTAAAASFRPLPPSRPAPAAPTTRAAATSSSSSGARFAGTEAFRPGDYSPAPVAAFATTCTCTVGHARGLLRAVPASSSALDPHAAAAACCYLSHLSPSSAPFSTLPASSSSSSSSASPSSSRIPARSNLAALAEPAGLPSSALRSGPSHSPWTNALLRACTAPRRPPACRPFHSSTVSLHGDAKKLAPGEGFKVTYILPDGEKKVVYAKEGWNLLDLAHANNIELEGACEGSLACSTCHLILDQKHYDQLEEPCDEENDMLDLAFGLTETSRLGCQVVMTPELDDIFVRIPSATRNIKDF